MKKHFLELECLFKNYHLGQFSELFEKLSEKRFTLKQLGITHRSLILWDREGLLNSSTEKGKWRRFNFFELVWIKVISKLRDFNIPIKTIRRLKENILTSIPYDELADKPEIIEAALYKVPDKYRQKAREILSDKALINREMSSLPMTILFLFIMDVILLKSHFAILVNLEGDFFPFKEFYIEEIQQVKGYYEFIHKSHVSVSLSEIVANFLIDEDLELTQNKLAILTEAEAQIINVIRNEKLSSLRIRFNEHNEVDLIEAAKNQKISKEARLIDLILKKGYQDIEIKTENGKIIKCKNTIKEKLRK